MLETLALPVGRGYLLLLLCSYKCFDKYILVVPDEC